MKYLTFKISIDFNRGDDFERRNGPPRDFYGPNRFGLPGPPGMGPRGGPMGRGAPLQFVPRIGQPMFMRGPRPLGPGLMGPPGNFNVN